jgi:hypothetical protein
MSGLCSTYRLWAGENARSFNEDRRSFKTELFRRLLSRIAEHGESAEQHAILR